MRFVSCASAVCVTLAAMGGVGTVGVAHAETMPVSVVRDGTFEVRAYGDGSRGASTDSVREVGPNGVVGGQFSWWVEVTSSQLSPQWTSVETGHTTVRVDKVVTLIEGRPCAKVNVRLLRWDAGKWRGEGVKTADGCDGADDLTWPTKPGDYRFEASPEVNGGSTIRAEGVTYYP